MTGVYRIDDNSTHTLFMSGSQLFVRRTGGPARPLAISPEGLLFYPGDEIDYYRVVHDPSGRVVALEYYSDGQGPPRREERLPQGARQQ